MNRTWQDDIVPFYWIFIKKVMVQNSVWFKYKQSKLNNIPIHLVLLYLCQVLCILDIMRWH